jgi:cyclic pyranopterin phosphate synthase
MIAHSVALGMDTHVTTNGILLGRQIETLHNAGLRNVTIGYYGTGGHYDAYVQRPERWAELDRSIATVRDRFGDDIDLRINWLLMRPSCNLEALHAALDFAKRYNLRIQVDLIHYSLPYFSEGPDRVLQFRPEDRPAIELVVNELLQLKLAEPGRFNQSVEGLRSIPDWLLLGPDMRVPCDARHMLWVGPDGTVQMCYVTFRLGNLNETRLRELVLTPEHHQAARDAFALACPNCHCHYDRRVLKHAPAAARYREHLPIPGPHLASAAQPRRHRPSLPVIPSPASPAVRVLPEAHPRPVEPRAGLGSEPGRSV